MRADMISGSLFSAPCSSSAWMEKPPSTVVLQIRQPSGVRTQSLVRCDRPIVAFARPFGTARLNVLIARIGCAISRAVHLEQKLAREAKLGALAQPAPTRHAPPSRGSRARPATPAARPQVQRAAPDIDPELAGLPSVAQIADEIGRRPGA